jgi:hypothetical protein
MPLVINGQNFYRTGEACRMAGTNRMTFLRWIRENKYEDVPYRDENGWRLFSEHDIRKLKSKTSKMYLANQVRDSLLKKVTPKV